MMSLSHWGMFDARIVPCRFFPLVWANDCDTEFYSGLPYFDAVFPGGKTGREIARENLKAWAGRASA